MQDKSLGDILLEQGILDKDQLNKAKGLQKKSNMSLGQVLIKRGLASEEDILQVLGKKFGLDFIDKLEVKNIEAILQRVPLRFVQKYRMVPYNLLGNTVLVAITDPMDLHPLDELRLMWIGFEVIPQLATESEILRIIHSHFEHRGEQKEGDNIDVEEGLEFLDEIEDLQDSIDLANEAPIIKMVNVILSNAVSERTSDIHVEPQEKEIWVRYRVDGVLHKVLTPPKSIQSGIVSRIKIMADMNIAENRLPQDGRIKIRFGGKDIDIRVSSLPTQFGERLVMRLLNKTDTKFEIDTIGFDAGIIKAYTELLKHTNGIILITGPTGSGKTSTLYASLTEVNDVERNIITVEDPVEYQMDGISQVQAHQKIGLTFAEGLRSILRQDPDIVMVGEIRDAETARVAIQASLTGHLVFSTLHTNDAPSAVTRLIDMGIEPYLITSTARGFMAQRLVRKLCAHCKKPKKINSTELTNSGYVFTTKKVAQVKVFEPQGCSECMNTGYSGRTGIYELLVIDNELRDLILSNPSLDALKKTAVKKGMKTLRQAALQKVVDGITSIDEALRVT